MTAEVAILNKSAVALAADSAATITSTAPAGGERFEKVFTNANKLFELIKGKPIGIMIYSNADLMDLPWETVIKLYREEKSQPQFSSLEEYADHFVKFVERTLITKLSEQERTVHVLVRIKAYTGQLLSAAEKRLHDVQMTTGARTNNSQRKLILETLVDEYESGMDDADIAQWAKDLDVTAMANEYGTHVDLVVPAEFQKYRIPKKMRTRMLAVAIQKLLCESDSPASTGLVIAGFGDDEVFPSLINVYVSGLVSDRLVLSTANAGVISPSEPAIIAPFAQTEEAHTFLMGIDPHVKGSIQNFWKFWLTELGPSCAEIMSKTARLSSSSRQSIEDSLTKYAEKSWSVFAGFMNEIHDRLRFAPIQDSAQFLSKPELASLAENLVNLSSLRARVAINRRETVGGAIDVAVISRGDGFVWIKRKHYFDSKLNPEWAARRSMNVVQSAYHTGDQEA